MMAEIVAQGVPHVHEPADGTKRDFLKLVTGATAAVGIGAIIWPLLDMMNPSADVLALSSTEVTLTPIPEGQGITVVWRGKPIFVRHRTAQEIKEAQDVSLSALPDPEPDSVRVKPKHDQWIVVIGICTHLGCVPLGNKPTDPRGQWGGWFCPCHGSQYDTSGRVRHGPAPLNLWLPPYEFVSDTKIRIGTGAAQDCGSAGCREVVAAASG
jgi:ubiquinol-cytochrome c reductase iron-sulfur subunit